MADAIVLTRPVGVSFTGGDVTGLTITVINGQPMLTLEDTTRSNKVLSVSEQVLVYAENRLSHFDWIRISTTSDAESGYVADFDGTITSITAHCENTVGNFKDIVVYVDNTSVATLGTLTGGANATINNQAVNIDFTQGQRIRLRAEGITSGQIEDTVIKLTIKWRES